MCFKIKYIPTWFFCIACRAAGCFSDKDSSILLNHKSWHFGSTRFSSQFFRKPQSEKSRWNYNSSKISIRILVRKTAIISNLIRTNNLQYNMLVHWSDGTNDSSIKCLTFQAFFFIISYRLRALKTLYFHFCNFIKKIEK